jgi:two-component system KDP operon response regulator KdpE
MTENEGPLVLIVEDEPPVRRFLRASLGSHGYRLLEADTAKSALSLATSNRPDLIVLDLGLPDGDGIDLTREIRAWSSAPIIVVSARGREQDKVDALDAGADDYVTKPFGVNELLARLRVAYRNRRSDARAAEADREIIEVGPIRLDIPRHQVTIEGSEVKLTPIEFKLLRLFAENAGRVLTHRQILKEIWGAAYVSHSHYVRVHLAELRKKIEANPARPRWLVTEQGVGYRLRDPDGDTSAG